ncbi:MAG: ribonuclease D [Alphaproteobacteria bacterium]
MTIYLHHNDLPADVVFQGDLAIDSETLGLLPQRDRLCVVQLSDGQGDAHLVKFDGHDYSAPNLVTLLNDQHRVKIFHYARFDIAVLRAYLGVQINPIFCTKIASKLVRTYTDRHGLKDLCLEMLGIELSKVQQSSDWGAPVLSDEQQTYAASDVLHLHELRDQMVSRLAREHRTHLAQASFNFLPTRAELDLIGWESMDIFSHR